jgi:hypothetical protein
MNKMALLEKDFDVFFKNIEVNKMASLEKDADEFFKNIEEYEKSKVLMRSLISNCDDLFKDILYMLHFDKMQHRLEAFKEFLEDY